MAHCDVKPENLTRDAQGRVRLIDFGWAKGQHLSDDANDDEMVSQWSP